MPGLMRIFDLLRLAPIGLALAACNDTPASETDSAGEDTPVRCEDSEDTPPIDNLRPAARLQVGPPGWRVEPLVPDGDGVLVGVTHYEPGHPGRIERWVEGQPSPQFVAELPPSRRILATGRCPSVPSSTPTSASACCSTAPTRART